MFLNRMMYTELSRNKKLYTLKESLPALDNDTFYNDDMIGLSVIDYEKNKIGKILHVFDFGAGSILEISFNKTNKTEMFPFKKEIFPDVRITEGYISFIEPDFIE